jgi:hypothetical protein
LRGFFPDNQPASQASSVLDMLLWRILLLALQMVLMSKGNQNMAERIHSYRRRDDLYKLDQPNRHHVHVLTNLKHIKFEHAKGANKKQPHHSWYALTHATSVTASTNSLCSISATVMLLDANVHNLQTMSA